MSLSNTGNCHHFLSQDLRSEEYKSLILSGINIMRPKTFAVWSERMGKSY